MCRLFLSQSHIIETFKVSIMWLSAHRRRGLVGAGRRGAEAAGSRQGRRGAGRAAEAAWAGAGAGAGEQAAAASAAASAAAKKLDKQLNKHILEASIGEVPYRSTLTIEKEKRNDKVRSLRF